MNNEFPESDSSDEDYVPDSKVEDAVSEIESDGDPEDHLSGSENEINSKGAKARKRTKKVKKFTKKVKVAEENIEVKNDVPETVETEQDKKKKADDLWADFMKDTGFKSKNGKPIPESSHTKAQQSSSKSENQQQRGKSKPVSKVKITQIFEFAGEEVKVEKEVDTSSAEARLLAKDTSKSNASRKSGGLGGIQSVLNQLGKKQKISTLEKTKLDWDMFKKDENLEEELETHNKGKDGYLERQDFLQRADVRRFEIEKEIRNVERAKRFNSAV